MLYLDLGLDLVIDIVPGIERALVLSLMLAVVLTLNFLLRQHVGVHRQAFDVTSFKVDGVQAKSLLSVPELTLADKARLVCKMHLDAR